MKKFTMRAGKYYIGDLCYIFNNEEAGSNKWMELCDNEFDKEGVHKLNGKHDFWQHGTMYGDGSYELLDSGAYVKELPVDAGLIGLFRLDELTNNDIEIDLAGLNLGSIHEFKNDFEVGYDEGVFFFGNLSVDTTDDDEEEYDEEEEYEEEEYEEE